MVLTVLAFGASRVQSANRDAGSRDVLGKAISAVVDPPSQVLARSLDANGRFWTGITQSGRIVQENERLRQQEQVWSLYAERVDALQQQLDQLRRLQNLPPAPGKTAVTAEVIHFDPHANRMTLSIGENKGVKVGQAVATPLGLLGVIQTVDRSRSQVLLLSSPSIRIGAMVNKRPPIAGLARGMGGDRMLLGFLEGASNAIGPGDQVVTSIHSANIPPYIRIGEVIRQQSQPEYGLVEIQVLLAVQPAEVRVVVVYQ